MSSAAEAKPIAAEPLPPMRPLPQTARVIREFGIRDHVISLPPGTPLEWLHEPPFWLNIVHELHERDHLEVWTSDGATMVELVVLRLQPNDPGRGVKGGAAVAQLQRHDFKATPVMPVPSSGHSVRYMGPEDLWCVIEEKTGMAVASRFASKDEALGNLVGRR